MTEPDPDRDEIVADATWNDDGGVDYEIVVDEDTVSSDSV